MQTRRHVVPATGGGWNVVKAGAKRISSHHDTEADAEARATDIVTKAGGGEVVVHRADGSVRRTETISPAYVMVRPATRARTTDHDSRRGRHCPVPIHEPSRPNV
jgi:hypothetical protein